MNEVDILEQWLVERNPILMDMLLRDRTTGGRIKWATANYEEKTIFQIKKLQLLLFRLYMLMLYNLEPLRKMMKN